MRFFNNEYGLVNTGEVYNPATGTFQALASKMSIYRAYHTATRLLNGTVLLAGGESTAPGYGISCDLFNPATAKFSPTGSMTHSRYSEAATRLPSGDVLVTGGYFKNEAIATTELYSPATGTWQEYTNLIEARASQLSFLNSALNGVIVIGGENFNEYLGIFDYGLATTEVTGAH